MDPGDVRSALVLAELQKGLIQLCDGLMPARAATNLGIAGQVHSAEGACRPGRLVTEPLSAHSSHRRLKGPNDKTMSAITTSNL